MKSKIKSKVKIKSKKKSNLLAVTIGTAAAIATTIGTYKLAKIKLQKEISEKLQKENLQNKYHEFLACNPDIKAFGNKSVFDLIPNNLIDKILVKFKSIQDINNQCLVNERIKKYCCDNRQSIFVEILKYNGYSKGIKQAYAEFIFSWFIPTKIQVADFYLLKYDFSDRTLAVFILNTVNNKFTTSDINNELYWHYYPIIYYYTSNTNIKNYILYKYNQLTVYEINSKPLGYYFYPGTEFIADYLKQNLIQKLGNISHNGMKIYSKLEVDYIKTICNLYIDY